MRAGRNIGGAAGRGTVRGWPIRPRPGSSRARARSVRCMRRLRVTGAVRGRRGRAPRTMGGWRVIELLVDLVVGAVLTLLFPDFGAKRRAKAEGRAFERGEWVHFEACLLGEQPFHEPGAVQLAASRTALRLAPARAGKLGRRVLPAKEIEVRRVRGRSASDAEIVRPLWEVAECRYGRAEFVIACAPSHMRLLVVSLGGKATHGASAAGGQGCQRPGAD